jgi:hypothetical protein
MTLGTCELENRKVVKNLVSHKYFKFILLSFELILFLTVAIRFFNLRTETNELHEKAFTGIKRVYQGFLLLQDPSSQQNELKKVTDELFHISRDVLGTYKTTCAGEPKDGWGGAAWSIEGLDPIPPDGMNLLYGQRQKPCDSSNIEVRPGKLGKLRDVSDQWDLWEKIVILGTSVLFLLKFLELKYTEGSPQQVKPNKYKKRK